MEEKHDPVGRVRFHSRNGSAFGEKAANDLERSHNQKQRN